MKNKLSKLELIIKKGMYNKDTFHIANAEVVKNKNLKKDFPKQITIKYFGVELKPKTRVLVDLEIEFSNVYGYTYKISNLEVLNDNTIEELRNYLKIDGVGKTKIEELIKEFGLEAIDAIKNKDIKAITILGVKKFNTLRNYIIQNDYFDRITTLLMSVGLTHLVSIIIERANGEEPIRWLKDNLKELWDLLEYEEMCKLADYFKLDNKERQKIYIIYELKKELDNGNLGATKKTFGFLHNKTNISEEVLNEMINEKELEVVVHKQGKREIENILLPSIYKMELNIAKHINNLNNTSDVDINEDLIIEWVERDTNITYSNEQRQAIIGALINKGFCLTGGPGTGKTQTVKGIISALKYSGYNNILLMAPTGKASDRMTQLTGMESGTIHRYVFKEEEKVSNAEVIIIDETSMVDIFILNKLLNVINEDTKMIFVGDVNQLPSIGAGDILRTMLNTLNSTYLTKIYRQAGDNLITLNAHSIFNNNGFFYSDGEQKFDRDSFIKFNFTEMEKINGYLIATINRMMEKFNYNLNDIMVLTATKEEARRINNLVQKTYNNNNKTVINDDLMIGINDRVMQTVNNYNLNVFNGMTGIVKEITDKFVYVEFNSEEICYTLEQAEELTLAYAITTHKSQGSEYKAIIYLLNTVTRSMQTKNLIYTGITRAKEVVCLLGDYNVYKEGIATESPKRKVYETDLL